MNKEEAINLLVNIEHDNEPCNINSSLTRGQGIKITINAIKNIEGELPHIFEKRVWQMVKNQKEPTFKED